MLTASSLQGNLILLNVITKGTFEFNLQSGKGRGADVSEFPVLLKVS